MQLRQSEKQAAFIYFISRHTNATYSVSSKAVQYEVFAVDLDYWVLKTLLLGCGSFTECILRDFFLPLFWTNVSHACLMKSVKFVKMSENHPGLQEYSLTDYSFSSLSTLNSFFGLLAARKSYLHFAFRIMCCVQFTNHMNIPIVCNYVMLRFQFAVVLLLC